MLDGWKSVYVIKERRIVDAAGDISEETITSWTERFQKLTAGYSLENIWNMGKYITKKEDKHKLAKTPNKDSPLPFFVNAADEKIDEPVVILKSNVPRCVRGLRDPSRPAISLIRNHGVSNSKSLVFL